MRSRVLRTRKAHPPKFFAMGAIVLGVACSQDLDATRSPPPRGTLGEELFGILCDRLGAQALREDMSGGSFNAVCHKDASGAYADTVDARLLPAASEGAVDTSGKIVSLDQQLANRAHAIHRVEALGRRRADLIEAFDATFPDVPVTVKDLENGDLQKTCGAPADPMAAKRKLGSELARMLGRFGALYDDGTIPLSTESLARLMAAFRNSPEAQGVAARFSSRQGYRPLELALGAARPLVAYPRLRDLSAETLRLVSADSTPYDPAAPRDSLGKRLPVNGAAYAKFSKMLETAHEELRTATANSASAPLAASSDSMIAREVLSRPRTNLELMEKILYAQARTGRAPFGGDGPPHYIVRRDSRGVAALLPGSVPLSLRRQRRGRPSRPG